MRGALLVWLALGCALPCRTSAQSEEPFGTRGQWLIGGSVGGSLAYRKLEAPPAFGERPHASTTEWSLWVAPEALVFVATNFALGARLSCGIDRFERSDDVVFKSNNFGAGVLLAYRVGLGENTFLLPELGLGVDYYDRTTSVPEFESGRLPTFPIIRPSAGWNSATVEQATLSLPFGWVLAPHFFAGLGPYVRALHGSGGATPRGDDWSVAVGITTMFGTWL